MRILVIAAVLVVGCSTTTNPIDARLTKFRQESQEISERERQCIRATVTRSNDQLARIAATPEPNGHTELRTQMVTNDRDRELSECKANAEREEEQLSARERAEYESRAKDERERNALMMILTTSQPR
jgi:septal ring factor EnvC (AmiA/AmiB activator)